MKKIILLVFAVMTAQVNLSAQWVEQATHFPVPGIGIIDMKAISADVAWAAGLDMSGPGAVPVQLFARTTDGGATWVPGTVPASNGYSISSITALDAQTAWISLYNSPNPFGATDGKIVKTTDGGQTWVQQAPTAFTFPQGFVNKVHFFDMNNGVAIGNPNNGYFEIYTTSNSGVTWTRVPQTNLPNPIADERGYVNVFSAVGQKIWFGTTKGRVFISDDRGLTWIAAYTGMTRQDPLLPLITNLDFKDANYGLVQNDSTMRRSLDGGLTWTDLARTGPVHIFDLRSIPGTASTWISTGANFQINDVGSSISTDNGLTWVAIDDSVLHTAIDFVDANTGWSGGLNANAISGGMYKWVGPTGLANQPESRQALLYPNPATKYLTIGSLAPGITADIELTDVTGRLILRKTVPATEAEAKITLTGVEPGIYLLQVRQQNKLQHGKVLVQ